MRLCIIKEAKYDYQMELFQEFKITYRTEEALLVINNALCLKINPNFAMCYSRMGTIMSYFKQKENELQYYNQAIQNDGNCYYAFMCKVYLYQAVEINPYYSLAYFNKALLYQNIGEKDKALNDYNKAIQLDPNDAEAYYNRAILYQEIGENEKALNDFNQAFQLNPNFVNAFYRKSVIALLGFQVFFYRIRTI
ncbi:unnamed protein product [Paramecium primaurelia]|uniref:Tetratricopeptide repeat protein n=1 Tax=Paramecium primaurelia TaxID=5886 RepID=A0A8S1NJZ0_PARPR|nr:unnamed protein product [Paramecium primaurelia]